MFFLAVATNIPVLLMTDFVLQGHIFSKNIGGEIYIGRKYIYVNILKHILANVYFWPFFIYF